MKYRTRKLRYYSGLQALKTEPRRRQHEGVAQVFQAA
jgi:hypothetical protein